MNKVQWGELSQAEHEGVLAHSSLRKPSPFFTPPRTPATPSGTGLSYQAQGCVPSARVEGGSRPWRVWVLGGGALS